MPDTLLGFIGVDEKVYVHLFVDEFEKFIEEKLNDNNFKD
jgi:hypothetical protein